jgi:gliding motility-associated-like protein
MYCPDDRQLSSFNRKASIRLLLIFLLGLIAVCGYAQISFGPYTAYSTGSFPQVVCIGDVNNDNLNDVVLGTGFYFDPENDYKIFVYLQNVSGNLNPPILYSYPEVNPGLSSISIADANSDGLNDVIIGYLDSIGIYYQNGLGTLNSIQNYYSGDNSSRIDGISTGDLNKDGLTDIAVSHWGATFITVFYQLISGGFDIHNYAAPTGGYDQIEVGDVNDDQRDDIVLMLGQLQGGIYVYTQSDEGLMNNYVPYFTDLGWYLGGIAIGDLNNDSVNDIAKTIYGNSPESKIAISIQDNFSHLLHPPQLISAYDNPEPVRIADLNCDGRNEIIVAHGAYNTLSVFEQDINDLYNSYTLFSIASASHYQPQGLCIGDINNDWKKDVVLADNNNGLIVLLNQSVNYGNCCELPEKPLRPLGDSIICSDNVLSVYKTLASLTYGQTWNLFPVQSGTIIFSDRDSCQILWNNAWRGVSGINILSTNSCGTIKSETLLINVDRLPFIDLGNDTTLCHNSTLELNAGMGYQSYLWQDNSTDSLFLVNLGGTYNVQVENICGIDYDTIRVTDVPLPQIDLQDTILCFGNAIQVDISGPGFSGYLWQDNSTNPVYTISNPGTYSVLITDTNSCQNSISFNVEYCPENLYLDVPSAFSPNDDGLNDILYAVGINVENIQLAIFNRWGQKVFESNDLLQGWDGTFKGQKLNSAVFVYTISAISTEDGRTIQKSGNISLIR